MLPHHGFPVVILGAGPAGVAAAWKLSARGWSSVTVLEQGSQAGGNAGSFVIDGIPVDFGSHRLHPASSPVVLHDIRSLLGDDLLDRPRRGRIRLRGRWLRFPLEPWDLATRLPPSFIAGVMLDSVRPARQSLNGETFASVLERGLGRTICRDFYFPYAEKIWGASPDALDAEQARRRVSSGSIGRMVARVLGALPGRRTARGRRFYYPRHGFGQIASAYQKAAASKGASIVFNARVTRVNVRAGRACSVDAKTHEGVRTFPAAVVLSTIPIAALARLVDGGAAAPVEAAGSLRSRAMVLVYLTLDADRFTEFDAHYFPERAIRITRVSEPKNYSLTSRPGRTVLCAELPCAVTDAEWSLSDEQLASLVISDLERAGLGPVPRLLGVETRRLAHAYPIYDAGYRASFDAIDRWLSQIDGLVTFGRQGLFVHDNTHHTLEMAYEAVACLNDDGTFDRRRWAEARARFENNVVED